MEGINKNKNYEENSNSDSIYILKMIIYSIIGVGIFFIPININNQNQTILYHIVDKIQLNYNNFLQVCIIIFISLGSIKLFIDKKRSKTFLSLRFLSVLIILNIFYGRSYIFFKNDNTILIIKEIILNLVTVLPISSIFMPFLIEYGLLDIVESYFHPITKKLFKVSGKTVINMMVFVFTDCFCGYYMANILYSKGRLRLNELYMLLLNFSIISFPMTKYIYNELNLNSSIFIFTNLLILIISNMILCRLYPMIKIKKSYSVKSNYKESIHRKDKLKKGINKYLKSKDNKKIFIHILDNLEHTINLTMNLIPNIVLIFFFGDLILNNEYILELFSKLFYPIINLLKTSDVSLISKSIVSGFYNEIIAIDLINKSVDYNIRFIIGILLVIKCTSLTSNIAYISSSSIEIDKKYFIIIFLERVLLILFLYSAIYYFYKGYIM
ncbi:hypothetical protein EAI30_10685 [Romboutsia ilealis]|uniref:Nucleoside transporter/FeoB GTPase Gate domain-containing protein n=1 Tax=Romboutsia faecis TaxID=2764597 RepID=A0ABR7JNW2_9FIRM|nr:hypothetical protein [Romboutsia faecis]MBC5996276.1 hypothetical protein [Romboutsia faecis]MRN25082.1 hypothetical protein [Romboutsia ilealis]